CGVLIAGVTMSGAMLLLGILFFSAGEMLTGTKKNEYLALIAPQDKTRLYLGYVNIPVGTGGLVGNKLEDYLYGNFGEKAVLAQRYLAEKTDYLAKNGRPAWNGEVATLGETLGVSRADAYDTLKSFLDLSGHDATDLLWTTYEPYRVWYYFA